MIDVSKIIDELNTYLGKKCRKKIAELEANNQGLDIGYISLLVAKVPSKEHMILCAGSTLTKESQIKVIVAAYGDKLDGCIKEHEEMLGAQMAEVEAKGKELNKLIAEYISKYARAPKLVNDCESDK